MTKNHDSDSVTLELKKFELEVQKVEQERRRTGLMRLNILIAALSLIASLVAAGMGYWVKSIADAAHQKLAQIDTYTNRGSAKAELIDMSIAHLELMVMSTNPNERDRACTVAANLAIIEENDFSSRHILALHREFSQLTYPLDGEVAANVMCAEKLETIVASSQDNPLSAVVVEQVGDDFQPQSTETGLATSVVVLASYRSQNCTIAQGAAEALGGFFSEHELLVVHTTSDHYSVVFNPTLASVEINYFLNLARQAGQAAKTRLANGDGNGIDSPNLQYVADAFIAGSAGWERITICPDE